jgi:hypothetical protein
MNGYLLDINIVTAHLKKYPGVRERMRTAELTGHPVRFNAVSYYETKRGLLAIGAHPVYRYYAVSRYEHVLLAAPGRSHTGSDGGPIMDADAILAEVPGSS